MNQKHYYNFSGYHHVDADLLHPTVDTHGFYAIFACEIFIGVLLREKPVAAA